MGKDDLPEIQLDEVLDQKVELEIDFDLELDDDSPPQKKQPTPPAAATAPSAPASPSPELDLDIIAEAAPELPASSPPQPQPLPPSANAAAADAFAAQPTPEADPLAANAAAADAFAAQPTPEADPLAEVALPDASPPDDAAISLESEEPAAEQPVVEPPKGSSLDLDALLSDIDLDSATKLRPRQTAEAAAAEPPPETELGIAWDDDEPDPEVVEDDDAPTLDVVTAEVGAALELDRKHPAPTQPSEESGWEITRSALEGESGTRDSSEAAPEDGITFEVEGPALEGFVPLPEPTAETPEATFEPLAAAEPTEDATVEPPAATDEPPAATELPDAAIEVQVCIPEPPAPFDAAQDELELTDPEPAAGEPAAIELGAEATFESTVPGGPLLTEAPEEEEAPPLPLDEGEPPPVSAISPEALQPDAETLEKLQRLAGPAADPEAARAALFAAIKGESYDARALPDARAIALGTARVLAATGFSINELVDSIIEAMTE